MTTINYRKSIMLVLMTKMASRLQRPTVEERIRDHVTSKTEQNQSTSTSKRLRTTSRHSTSKPALGSLLQSCLQPLPGFFRISSHGVDRMGCGKRGWEKMYDRGQTVQQQQVEEASAKDSKVWDG
jgi:hypothetical protein